jgi:hypothetical protein
LASGWQTSLIFQYQSGWPWALPANATLLKDPRLSDIDWSAARVTGINTCASRWNDNGTITMLPASVSAGCSSPTWLVMPRFGPARYLPVSDGRIRLHTVPIGDLSFNKSTVITEQVRLQFRVEIFNLTNTYMHNFQAFTNNPENVNFGTLTRATVSSTNTNLPRNVQLGFKLLW